jgi:hypothetical protein
MAQTLSTLWRVQSANRLMECVLLDAPGGPQLVVQSSDDEPIVVDSPSNARALMARCQRIRDELVAQGWWDAS